jgi:hypothetical protein
LIVCSMEHYGDSSVSQYLGRANADVSFIAVEVDFRDVVAGSRCVRSEGEAKNKRPQYPHGGLRVNSTCA